MKQVANGQKVNSLFKGYDRGYWLLNLTAASSKKEEWRTVAEELAREVNVRHADLTLQSALWKSMQESMDARVLKKKTLQETLAS